MFFEDLKKKIADKASLLCDEMGLDLIDVSIKGTPKLMMIQILADRPLGGIGFQECSKLNRRIDDVLFHELNLGEHYTLEVSSPGIDRWLFGYQDLRRVIGRDVQVIFKEVIHGKHEATGLLKAVRQEDIILEVKKEEWVIPMLMIEKSKQVIL